MSAFRGIYFDTNIFIHLMEGAPGEAVHLSRLVRAASGGPPSLFSSELTLSELLVRPFAQQQADLIKLYDDTLVTGEWLTVAVIDRYILRIAALLRARHRPMKLPDAIHLAAAVRAGCSHFMTADTDFDGTYVLDASQGQSAYGSARIDVIRPFPEVLNAISEQLAW